MKNVGIGIIKLNRSDIILIKGSQTKRITFLNWHLGKCSDRGLKEVYLASEEPPFRLGIDSGCLL